MHQSRRDFESLRLWKIGEIAPTGETVMNYTSVWTKHNQYGRSIQRCIHIHIVCYISTHAHEMVLPRFPKVWAILKVNISVSFAQIYLNCVTVDVPRFVTPAGTGCRGAPTLKELRWTMPPPETSFDTQLHLEHLLWRARRGGVRFTSACGTLLRYLGTLIESDPGKLAAVHHLNNRTHALHIWPYDGLSTSTRPATIYPMCDIADGHFTWNIKTNPHHTARA